MRQFLLGGLCGLAALTFGADTWGAAPSRSSDIAAQNQTAQAILAQTDRQWQFLEEYCIECHNVTDWAGGVAFDAMSPDTVPEEAAVWEEVVRRVRGRMMPPPGEPRPEIEAMDAFVAWMESYLDHAASQRPDPGYVVLHRLNRKEYANAVKYLLDLDVDPVELLPQDDVSDNFDNIASVLQVSPSFLDQYLAAARTVAVQAIGNPSARPGGTPYVNPDTSPQHFHVDGLPFGTRGGMVVEHTFPADGEYELNINDMARALWVETMEYQHTLIATLDGKKFYETQIGGEEDMKAIDQQGDPAVTEINKRLKNIRFKATAGQHKVAVTFVARSFAESEARLASLLPGGGEERVPKVRTIEIRGPFTTEGVSETASRRRIFTCYPASEAEEAPCARQVLGTIARRAYRRPVTDGELDGLMRAYERGRQGQSFDAGIRAGLTNILASPAFLFRSVQPPKDLPPGAVYELNDLQLASRLSFFLWSNVPDDELLGLAEQGKLSDRRVLEQQVRRMLADERSRTLASNFAYQWLGLRKLDEIEPDPAVFPYASNHRDIEGDLRGDFVREIELFVDSVFRENRSVLELLEGRHTFLNERLALHYGIENLKGDRFRRVELEDSARWGLLGKGGVLMVSSYPNRTAPVLRGAWILENLLGTPPTPPPPNVEALIDNQPGQEARTVRELMAAHSAEKSCFSCHGVMDPLGFALENFDGVGRWRDKDRFAGTPIDSSGVLPDGTEIDGPDDLRQALVSRPDQFVQTLTQKLMTYAIGRVMEHGDMPAVRAVAREAQASDYRFVPLVMSIVNSPPFRMQRVPLENEAEVQLSSRGK